MFGGSRYSGWFSFSAAKEQYRPAKKTTRSFGPKNGAQDDKMQTGITELETTVMVKAAEIGCELSRSQGAEKVPSILECQNNDEP